jgi:hypothetical protein
MTFSICEMIFAKTPILVIADGAFWYGEIANFGFKNQRLKFDQ